MTTTTTRRAILAGAAAFAAADAPPIADPIFAAIAAHREAFAEHGDENWMDVYLDDGSHQSFMESLVLSIADAMDAISGRGEVRS